MNQGQWRSDDSTVLTGVQHGIDGGVLRVLQPATEAGHHEAQLPDVCSTPAQRQPEQEPGQAPALPAQHPSERPSVRAGVSSLHRVRG